MKSIKIGVKTSDAIYTEHLGIRLAELMAGLEVYIIGREFPEGIDIYLCDDGTEYDFPKALPYVPKCTYKLDVMDSAKETLHKALKVFETITGESLLDEASLGIEVYSFYSAVGGAGTSSIATTFARKISSERGIRTILINNMRGGENRYVREVSERLDAASEIGAEITYLLGDEKLMKTFDIESHIAADDYGVAYISVNGRIPNLIEYLDRNTDFKVAVIDAGTSAADAYGKTWLIRPLNDARTLETSSDEETEVIYNKALKNENSTHRTYIKNDEKAFRKTDWGVEIDMASSFAKGVGNIDK